MFHNYIEVQKQCNKDVLKPHTHEQTFFAFWLILRDVNWNVWKPHDEMVILVFVSCSIFFKLRPSFPIRRPTKLLWARIFRGTSSALQTETLNFYLTTEVSTDTTWLLERLLRCSSYSIGGFIPVSVYFKGINIRLTDGWLWSQLLLECDKALTFITPFFDLQRKLCNST